MGPEPGSSKSRGSRYRSNEAQASHRTGDSMERGLQRSESGKSKSDKDGGGTESGRGVKRRQHGGGGGGGGGGGDGGQGGTSGSMSSTHRSSKRWRGDAHETLGSPIPPDRWDGGTADTHKENALPSGKSKRESESRSGEGIPAAKSANAQVSKDGGDLEKASRKQKGSKGSLVLDSRAITVMDLQETDVSIMESNIRIKNKVSHRRETMLELGDPELEKSGDENAKNAVESSRSKRRWDKDGYRGGAEDAEDAHTRGNVSGEGSHARERRKEKSISRDRERDRDRDRDRDKDRDRDRDRDAEARMQNGRRSTEGSRDLAGEVDGRFELSDDLDASNDFKIQEELRNIELEKELENRIRRRREESGDRDKWPDDERDRDVKRHSNSRERDERAREERHRSRRERERHSDRYDSRQHREGSKVSEGRQREDRYYESDREYRSHREERHPRGKDLEDHARGDRNREQDYRDRKARDTVTGYEAERRASREKGQKEDQSDRSYPLTAYVESSDGVRSEHRNKRVRESDGEGGYGPERDHSRQRGRPGDSDTMTGNGSAPEDRIRRNREDREAEGRLEGGSRGSPREKSDGVRGKGKSSLRRNDSGPSEMGGDGFPSPRHDARGSPSSNRIDYLSSPHRDDQRSPRYRSHRSPSYIERNSGASRGKAGHGDWLESGNSASMSSGGPPRRSQGPSMPISDRRERGKWISGSEEDAKGGMYRGNRSTDEGRDGSVSPPHRLSEQHLPATQSKPPLHGQDNFPRGMGGSRGMMDARSDRGGWRGSSSTFDGGAMDHHGPDDLSPRDRNDRLRRMPMNRPPGSPMVRSQGPQMSSLPAPQLAPLPPPPPFRPGIDNPSVLGHLSGAFDDGGGSRELGRGDRKGGPHRRGEHPGGMGPGEGWRGVNMGNWNSRNQGPLPGNGFAPFPPPFGHPPAGGGFPGMGQQFPGPPIFPGGGRPPMDMGFGGGRFLGPGGHMGDGGDVYLGPGRGPGWHGPGELDDIRGPPLLGPGDGWDGPGPPHADDRLRHGRMEWERGGPMGVRGWERDREREMWEPRRDGAPPDFMPHRAQMDPPQNQPFPSPVGGWGVMQRDAPLPNEPKHRQDRQSFDIQEAKRKPDGGGGPPKPKVVKSAGPGVAAAASTNEGRLSKYATATMQSVLSQLHISPDLAGPELYAQYLALLPAVASGKQRVPDEQDDSIFEPVDEDFNLEADPEGDALIAAPNLLAKLLPPLPDGVFEDAIRLYRKPETENRVLKSSRGSFVLPFDPSTIKVPSISLMLNRYQNVGEAKDARQDGVGEFLDRLEVSVLDAEFAEEFFKPNDGILNTADQLDGAGMEDREGEAMQEEFVSSHVEVAEYSDREFETEMEDNLEEYSLKEMPVGGGLLGRLGPVDEDNDSVDNMVVYKESRDPTAAALVYHVKESITEADNNNWPVINAPNYESAAVAEMEDQGDIVAIGDSDKLDNVVVDAYQVDDAVVVADEGDSVVVVGDEGDSVVVVGDEGDSVVVVGDEGDSVVVVGDEGDSVVVVADHAVDVVVVADHGDGVVVVADRRDNVVVQAYQRDGSVVEADEENSRVVQAYQMDTVLVEANPGDKAVVQAYEVDTIALNADEVDAAMVAEPDQGNQVTAQMDEIDQADSVVEVADQADDLVAEADQQSDSLVVEADQADELVVEADQQADELVAEADQADNPVAEAGQVEDMAVDAEIRENVNSFVVSKSAVNYTSTTNETQENDEVNDEVQGVVEETVALEVMQAFETSAGELAKPHNVQFPAEISDESPLEAQVHEGIPDTQVHEGIPETQVHGGILETQVHEGIPETQVRAVVEAKILEAFVGVESNEQVKDAEAVEAPPESASGEGNGLDVKQGPPSETGAVEAIQNHLAEDVLSAAIEDDDATEETHGKLKEIVENSPAPEPAAIEEPQPEPLRKRRASSRLMAQQAVEAQAVALQEQPSDGLSGQGSVGVKKQGTRGSTRTSQRRSKRRGSTH